MNLVKVKNRLKKVEIIKKYYDRFRTWSIQKAIVNQGLIARYNQIARLNIDVANQYTSTDSTTEYIKTKILGLHSFQMMLFAQFINGQKEDKWKVFDLGDSSGNHLLYIKNLFKDYTFNTISINIDREAIKRICQKDLNTICCSIEEFTKIERVKKEETIILMFETLEHLENPIEVLKGIKQNIQPEVLILTVPFVRKSRVGLHHLRNNLRTSKEANQENTHIFELSPEDWMLLFKLAGFEVEKAFIYYQYPKWNLPLRYYWEKFDFEGFFGIILK